MKKVEKVSIANISFTLDNDAYVALRQYLNSLHNYYGNDPDGNEIIADIEGRIAEIILGEQVYTKVVSKPLVERIISQLGTPEEIDSETDNTTDGAFSASTGTSDTSIPRRLYRSREGRIFGGVCSGMAQYFDVNVAWIRLAFLLPTLLVIIGSSLHAGWLERLSEGWGGVFFVLYIVLWVSIPIAKSARQKLEARGARITPSSIRRNLQESATTPQAKKAASVGAELLAVGGRIVLFFIKFVVAVIGFSLLIGAFAVLIALVATFANPLALTGYAAFSTALAGMTILSPMLFVALVLFCVMMPLLVCGMALLSLVFNWRLGRLFYAISLGLWLLASVFCTVVVASNARYLRDNIRGQRIMLWSNEDWVEHHEDADGKSPRGIEVAGKVRIYFDDEKGEAKEDEAADGKSDKCNADTISADSGSRDRDRINNTNRKKIRRIED